MGENMQNSITEEQTTLLERAELAKRVYEEAFHASESFYGTIGMTVSYLLGALLQGSYIELTEGVDIEPFRWLKETYSADHPVWGYIRIDKGEDG